MPSYAYQVVASMLQVFQYCVTTEQYVEVEPFDFVKVFSKPSLGDYLNLFIYQLTPSRFNILPDLLATVMSIYLN